MEYFQIIAMIPEKNKFGNWIPLKINIDIATLCIIFEPSNPKLEVLGQTSVRAHVRSANDAGPQWSLDMAFAIPTATSPATEGKSNEEFVLP